MNENFESIVISSRIRLARNFSGFNFFTKLHEESDAVFIINRVKTALNKYNDFEFMRLKNLSLNECNALLERHIISKELIENKDISAVALSPAEDLIVMVNEEDHIREQCILNGFRLYDCFEKINALDQALLSEIDIAYSDDYGFLTSSPANLGTAMRASVMLFLPGIERNGDIENLIKEAREQGITFRGLYGEGTANYGSFYQISNQNSLGLNENDILTKVNDYVYEICYMEMSAREDILSRDYTKLQDEIYRAYGILKECLLLNEKEMIEMLALIKLGEVLGFLEILDYKMFDELIVNGQSANLMDFESFSSNLKEDAIRSKYINKKIKELVVKK